MKNIYKIFTLGLLTLGVMNSCSNDFGDMNVDPEKPTETVPDYVFTELIKGIGYIGNANLYLYNPQILPLLRVAVNLPVSDFDKLSNDSGVSGVWNEYYLKLRNINELRNLIAESPSDPARHVNQLAMLEIYQAYFALSITDKFGDIPYLEAGQGSDLVYRAAYDSQGDVYKAILTKLQAAITSLNLSGTTSSGENVFDFDANSKLFPGGNAVDHFNNWAKFGNSLLLKYGLRMSEFDISAAQGYIQAGLQGPLMQSEADGVQIVPGDLGSQSDNDTRRNSWGWARYYDPTSQPTQFLASLLVDAADITMVDPNSDDVYDPRFYGMFFPNSNGDYKILPNSPDAMEDENLNLAQSEIYMTGENGSEIIENWQDPRYGASHAIWNRFYAMSVFLGQQMLTYSEHCLILAEIYASGLASGDAESMYNIGVASSVREYFNLTYAHYYAENPARVIEVTEADIMDMLAHSSVSYDAANAMEQIGKQRYLDYFYRPAEAWAMVRRTNLFNFEVNYPIKNGGSTIQDIFRIKYPANEQEYNTENYLDQLNKMGGTDDIRYKADIFK